VAGGVERTGGAGERQRLLEAHPERKADAEGREHRVARPVRVERREPRPLELEQLVAREHESAPRGTRDQHVVCACPP
jgi:hypothetical protein